MSFRLSPEAIAIGLSRALGQPETPAPVSLGRHGPFLPLPDLAWHGDLPDRHTLTETERARAARLVELAKIADDEERLRDTFRPDFATSVARARSRQAAELAEKAETPPRATLPPRPKLTYGARELPVETTPAAPLSDPASNRLPIAEAEEETRRLASIAEIDARMDRIRADLEARDDKKTGTHALKGTARRTAHHTVNLLAKIRARLMLPETAARRIAATESFVCDSEENTGMSMSVEQYGAAQSRRLKLGEMAHEICRRLELAGINAYRDAGDVKLWRYFIHTELLEELPQYRRVCINPAIAAQSRANILASLEFFIQNHKFCRFWTFTTGPRCFAKDIPARLDENFARLRKLNHWMRKTYGLEVVLRATEFGTLEMHENGDNRAEETQSRIHFETDPATGRTQPTYHPHFHLVVYSLRGYRPRDEWTALCKRVRARWGRMVDFGEKGESAVIQNAREIVKYVTKPGDVLRLDQVQLREFYEATSNRRLVQPMGTLRADIARRIAAEKCLLRRRVKAGVWRWCEVDDHNKGFSVCESPEERAAADEQADANAFEMEMRRSRDAAPDWRKMDEVTTILEDGTFDRESSRRVPVGGRAVPLRDMPQFCKVVAFMRPATGPTRRKENCVMVMGNALDLPAVRRHPLVESLWWRTVDAWRAGEAMAAAEEAAGRSAIFVHTGTVSVRGETPPDPPRRPQRSVQLHFEHA